MSTDKAAQAQQLRQTANVLVQAAAKLEEDVAKEKRKAAFERVAKVFCEIQETDEGCEALAELTLKATYEIVDRPDEGWSRAVVSHLRAFCLVFTLDYDALNQWVSDVAYDQAVELGELEDLHPEELQAVQEVAAAYRAQREAASAVEKA